MTIWGSGRGGFSPNDFETYAIANSYQTKDHISVREPTGFVDWTDSNMWFDEVTNIFHIEPVATEYVVFAAGKEFIKTTEETIETPDVEGIYYIYFDADGVLQYSASFDSRMIFGPWIFVTIFVWDAVNKELPFGAIQNERHELMSGADHDYAHNSEGLRINSGLGLIDFDLSEDGSVLTSCQFGREAGSIADEDIKPDVLARASTVSPHVVYMSGAEANPVWRKGTPTAGTGILNAASGRAMYNKLNAGVWSLEEVPDGYFVNYHSIITTSDTSGKEEFTIPGHEIYESKSAAIVKQVEEVIELVSKASITKIAIAEYNAIGSVLINTDDTYTNAAKSVIVSIGGGRNYNDFRLTKLNNASAVSMGNPVIPTNLVRGVHDDFVLAESDMEVHAHNSNNDKIIGTVPTVSGLARTDRPWLIGKISQDMYPVIVTLETPSDSQAGEAEHSWKLENPGDFLRISITEHGKYNIQIFPNASDSLALIEAATLKPTLASTTLTCNGDLVDISAESSVDVSFRYREIGELTWIASTGAAKTVEGTFTEDVTVTAALDYEIQAVAEDVTGNIAYGDVKNTLTNYYSDISSAKLDGLIRYWDLQETSGTDTAADEKLGSGDDIVCTGGVAIASDSINGNTIYRRVFGSGDSMEAPFTFANIAGDNPFSMLIQVDARTTSGDHTIFSVGSNIFSLAVDGTGIQIGVNGRLATWSSATPTGMINILLRARPAQRVIKFHVITYNSVTWKAQVDRQKIQNFNYLRMANGTNGDSNHQDGEFFANGDIRSIAVWNKDVSDAEVMDIINTLDVLGMLIV